MRASTQPKSELSGCSEVLQQPRRVPVMENEAGTLILGCSMFIEPSQGSTMLGHSI